MKFARALVLILAGSAVLWGFAKVMNSLDGLKDPRRLAFILKSPSLPSSVRDVDCSSDAIPMSSSPAPSRLNRRNLTGFWLVGSSTSKHLE